MIVCTEAALVSSLPSSLTPTRDAVIPGCCEVPETKPGGKEQAAAETDSPLKTGILPQTSLDNMREDASVSHDHLNTIILPFSCMSYTATNQAFVHHISASIAQASLQPPPSLTEDQRVSGNGKSTTSSGDGYFEMGLPEGEQTVEWNGPTSADTGHVHVVRVLWSFTIQIKKAFRQFASCLVLTDESIAVFEIPAQESLRGNHAVPSALKLEFCFPYTDLTEFGFLMPEMCLTLKVRQGEHCFLVLSDAQSLQDFYCCLCLHSSHTYADLRGTHKLCRGKTSLHEFVSQLLDIQDSASNGSEIKGFFPVYLYPSSPAEVQKYSQSQQVRNKPIWTKDALPSYCNPEESASQSPCTFLPCWLLLTGQYLHILKINFIALLEQFDTCDDVRNVFKMSRIPLASVLVHPPRIPVRRTDSFADGHMLQLLLGYTFMAAVFILPHEKFHFARIYSLLRSYLQDVKTILIFRSLDSTNNNLVEATDHPNHESSFSKPHVTLSALYPSESGLQRLTEDNLLPFYLPISSALHYVAGLTAGALVDLFHTSVAEVENEQLRHLMWSSVVFYKSPDVEVTACVLLSTKAVYFLLDDRVALRNEHQLDFWNQKSMNYESSPFHLSYCFVLKLVDLQSVYVGLFDQYFRFAGPAADHIVTCLTRDSYCTHAFVQHLMAVLSLLARTPSPEPAEKDFYSEFGNKNTGKMENYEVIHSSRVKFIYPSEEEIGDLTFIVMEKMDPMGSLQTLNILLYVLAFQVSPLSDHTQAGSSLQPKTLILTSSDLFLLNEDFISYPLPDFAKEPPKKDKYQFVDGRRIRDLDRVLMGYQTYPQALTFVFDDVQNHDLMQSLALNHFGEALGTPNKGARGDSVANREVQWCIFIPSADCREKLISLLARQWEILCGRELPLELTG